MDIAFYTDQDLFYEKEVCEDCEEIVRQAQAQGFLNTAVYRGDYGTYVAFDGDKGIGYLSLSVWCTPEIEEWWEDGSTVYVEQVAVRDEYRGFGVARSLYAALEEDGQFSRIICSISRSNEASQAAHEALGFEVAGEHDNYIVYLKEI